MTTTALAPRQAELMLADPARQPGPLHSGRLTVRCSPPKRSASWHPLPRRPTIWTRRQARPRPFALRRARRARLRGLRPAARRPDPGRQHRPDEGREALRPERGRAARLVRGALDSRRNPRIRAAQLAAREGRDDEGPAQAVLQPSQVQEAPRLAQPRGDARPSRTTSA